MRLPYVTPSNARRKHQTMRFAGVNYGDGVADGELENSRNVTSERFPCLSPRAGRSREGEHESATAVYYKNGQFVVNGTELLYNGEVIANVTEGKKQFASVNTKVVIFPDKIMYDTATGVVRRLSAVYTAQPSAAEFTDKKTITVHQGAYHDVVVGRGNIGGAVSNDDLTMRPNDKFVHYTKMTLNTETGEWSLVGQKTTVIANIRKETLEGGYTDHEVTKSYVQVGTIFTKATDVSTGAVLVDLDPAKQFAVVTKKYAYAPTYPATSSRPGYTKSPKYGFDYEIHEIQGESYDAFAGFEALGFLVGDTVEIGGCVTKAANNGAYTIRGLATTTDDQGNTLYQILFDDEVFSQTGVEIEGMLSITRKTPNLSVICESNNRLWGAEGNTIFASALGDPTNFYTYDGLDTDSYAVGVASEGVFTGCCGFGNSVLFWKEDKLHKILGAYPSQYTMYEYNVPGVKRGSENSLVNVNEVIYYHGREGVYRYSGGSPELISENFGLRRFQEAAAGAEGDRYYISMQDVASKEWGLWVYDILRGIWMQEDESQGMDFAYNEGKLYYISGDGGLMCVNPEESDEAVAWSATTTRMDEVVHERKYYPKLNIRLDLPVGSTFVVEVSQDDGAFRQIGTFEGTTGKTVILPILLPRCDNFRIRMSGSGPVLIRSIVREYEVGSELF